MKNLKFRIWDKQLNKFLYQLPEKHHLDWERFEVQQFTGLADKRGVEIYEGDIIQHSFYPTDIELGKRYDNYIVKFENGCFRLNEFPIYEFTDYKEDGDEFEVIGNIYENEELLNNN